MAITRLLTFIFLFIILQVPLYADTGEREFNEYEVKAGFIYNFAKFIEWPGEAHPDAKITITLCIVGTDPFGKILDSIDNKTIRGKFFEIKQTRLSKDLKHCSILFISNSEKLFLPSMKIQ